MSEVILPQEAKHECTLPWDSVGYGSTGVPVGTLACCTTCGRWWRSVPCFQSYGPTDVWARVRWFHFGTRRRIKREAQR